jgi:V/A-type H+/Na+-transporting ATPase subunit I
VSFLRPVAMAKVSLVGLKEDRERIVGALHDLGVFQVEPVAKETLEFVAPEHGSDQARAVADQMIRFRGLRSALPTSPGGPPRAFADLPAILATTGQVPIDDEVGALKREEDALLTERKSLTDQIDLLVRYSFYTDRLELLVGPSIVSLFGEAAPEKFEELRAQLPALAHLLTGPVGEHTGFVLSVPNADADVVGRLAQRLGISLAAAPRLTGTPAQARPPLEARRSQVDARLTEIRGRLSTLSAAWYPTILALEEALTIENRKFESYGRLGAGERTFTVEGWVPKRDLPKLEAAVATASGGTAQLFPIETKERAPTLMDNPPGIRRYEFFIRFYAIPQADEWDPTWVFALVFPVFFGLMLGDIGYGLVILFVSLWFIAGFPGAAKLPKGPKNMIKTIVSPWAMREIAYCLIPGCIIAIAAGVFFDSFFGFHFYPIPIFDPIAKIAALLLLAGYIGVAMVTMGFFLGALKEYYHHHLRAVVGKFGGIVLTWGIALFGLSVLRSQTSFTADPGYTIGLLLTVVGVVLLIGGEGIMIGGLGIIEVVSHILSYTRLIGILLASVILALVINEISHGAIYGGAAFGIIGGVVLLIVGQGFNIIIGVFEPGIQGARLLFVENFSKYYEGNGRPFRPLRSARKYTIAVAHSTVRTAPLPSGAPVPA